MTTWPIKMRLRPLGSHLKSEGHDADPINRADLAQEAARGRSFQTSGIVIQTFLPLAGVLFAVGIAAYLSIRYMSGHFGNTRASDFLLWVSCATSLCFVLWADLIDAGALVVYAIVVAGLRLLVLKRPLREPEIAFHMAMLYLTLSRLDKVSGYGHPNDLLVVAQYIFLISIVLGCMCKVFYPGKSFAICALFLLIFPVTHFPLELARNIVARVVAPNVANLYVTKLYANEIYGLRFDEYYWVDRYSLSEGEFRRKDSNILLDGGGSLGAQVPIVDFWDWRIVKMLFGGQRAEK